LASRDFASPSLGGELGVDAGGLVERGGFPIFPLGPPPPFNGGFIPPFIRVTPLSASHACYAVLTPYEL